MKYDWIALEKEYITSNFKSVSAFLKYKNIKRNGKINEATKGWKGKKVKKEEKKSKKTIEKVIEIESTNDAKKIVDLKNLAENLALDLEKARTQLDRHIAKKTKKLKTVKYDYKTKKPKEETVEEIEEITDYESIIDRKGLKYLTSALKDLNDIIPIEPEEDNDNSFIEALNGKVEEIWNEEE